MVHGKAGITPYRAVIKEKIKMGHISGLLFSLRVSVQKKPQTDLQPGSRGQQDPLRAEGQFLSGRHSPAPYAEPISVLSAGHVRAKVNLFLRRKLLQIPWLFSLGMDQGDGIRLAHQNG